MKESDRRIMTMLQKQRELKMISKLPTEADLGTSLDISVSSIPFSFGIINNILIQETGSGFGEMALISDDVRNATIISDTRSQFLVLDKVVYNRSLRKTQEADFKAFSNFVNSSPLFLNWSPRYKKQVAMSLSRSIFPFETEIVKQGSKINGIGFIVE